MGECGVGGSSAGGAGGCALGGAELALRPAEGPRRATHEVSITLTPMLGTQTGGSALLGRSCRVPKNASSTGKLLGMKLRGDRAGGEVWDGFVPPPGSLSPPQEAAGTGSHPATSQQPAEDTVPLDFPKAAWAETKDY